MCIENDNNNLEMFKDLIGEKIKRIFINEENLIFITENNKIVSYKIDADCCSRSIFYDFIGVKKLLDNGPIISVSFLDVKTATALAASALSDDFIQAYGIEIVTEHKEWGEQTSVVSFRNISNGYYYGWIEKSYDFNINSNEEIIDDVLEVGDHSFYSVFDDFKIKD